jgi:bacteriocin-like protein
LGYAFGRQHIRWLGNEGAKMSKDSKDTKPNTDVENKKTQLTEEELKEISGGKLSDPEEGGQATVRSR